MADKDDKTEEPTARRIDEARKKGDVVYSAEVGTWIMLAAGAFVLMMMGGPMADAMGRLLIGFLSSAATMPVDGVSLRAMMMHLGVRIGMIMGLAMLAFAVAGIASRMLQDKLVFTTQRLNPSFDKINPMQGFSRILGKQAFSNLAKGALKMIVVGSALVWVLWPRDSELEMTPLLDVAAFWPLMQEKAIALFTACLAAYALIAGVDYLLTKRAYREKLKMSRQEVKEEFRQAEGDPQVKAKLRNIRLQRASQRMLTAVPEATVVVMNPTHYAVALKYEAGETAAPVCVAKGVDDLALAIRDIAEDNNVPIVEDPPLARALHASSEVDRPIPREHYEAVAKVIGYVMRLAERRRRSMPPRPNRPQ